MPADPDREALLDRFLPATKEDADDATTALSGRRQEFFDGTRDPYSELIAALTRGIVESLDPSDLRDRLTDPRRFAVAVEDRGRRDTMPFTMDYVRIYSDEHGDSHFEDVSPEMSLECYASAQWLISEPLPVDGLRLRRVVSDFPDEPHLAPRRQFIVGLAGEVEVEVSDGETRRFGPGSVILVEDTTGKGHRTRRLGETVRETLFISVPDQGRL